MTGCHGRPRSSDDYYVNLSNYQRPPTVVFRPLRYSSLVEAGPDGYEPDNHIYARQTCLSFSSFVRLHNKRFLLGVYVGHRGSEDTKKMS